MLQEGEEIGVLKACRSHHLLLDQLELLLCLDQELLHRILAVIWRSKQWHQVMFSYLHLDNKSDKLYEVGVKGSSPKRIVETQAL